MIITVTRSEDKSDKQHAKFTYDNDIYQSKNSTVYCGGRTYVLDTKI